MKKSTKALLLKAKKQIFGELAGNNLSKRAGDGFDFFELRPYAMGEDVRRIDWKRSAKMGEPYVKSFHEEKELQVVFVSLLSGGLHFGTHRLKQEVMCEIGTIVGYSAVKNADKFSLLSWQNKDNFTILPPTKSYHKIDNEIDKLIETDMTSKECDFEGLNDFLLTRYKRRSLIIICGDFWKIPRLGAVAKKHELLSIIVRDKFEEKPSKLGTLNISNPSSMDCKEVSFDDISIKLHEKKVHQHDKALFETFAKQGVRASKIYPHEPLISKMHSIFR